MRVCVTGGRSYGEPVNIDGTPISPEETKRRAIERQFLNDTLNRIHDGEHGPIDHLLQGGSKGADRHAMLWARSRGVGYTTFHAEWKKLGRAAGPIRNQQMLDEGQPDLVIAFPGGAGTRDMIHRAKLVQLPLINYGD